MIHKISTSWIKSTTEEESFTSAWTTIINAVVGAWGDITFRPFTNIEEEKMKVTIVKSVYNGHLDTTVSGAQTIVTPYTVEDFVTITIQELTGELVTNTTVYIVNQNGANPPELTVTLPSGRKIIHITGTARRI